MPSGSSRSKTFRGLSFVECPESKFNCTAVVGSKQFHQNQWTRHSIMAEETAESAANAARQEPAQRFGKCRLCVSRFAQSRWIAAQTTSLRKSPARATMSPTGWAGGGTHACSHLDFELVIAVDVSYSMDPEEQALQREGYVLGLTSREFIQALRNGNHGRIAITFFEWAGLYDQKTILPWRLIEGPESAEAVANEIRRTPYRRAPWTSIFGALQFAKPLFGSSG